MSDRELDIKNVSNFGFSLSLLPNVSSKVLTLSYGDIYSLHLGLVRWSHLSSNRDFSLLCYLNLRSISEHVRLLASIVMELEAYYKGLEELYSSFGISPRSLGEVSLERRNQLQSAISSYRDEHSDLLSREEAIRSEYSKKLQERVDVSLFRVGFNSFPDSITVQDIDSFRFMMLEYEV